MNLPNKLTLVRCILTPIFLALMLIEFPFHYAAALLVFIAASLTDYFDGKIDEASRMQIDYCDLIDALFCEVNPIPVKAAMKRIGFDCGDCRLPLCRLTKEHQKQIDEYFF